MSTNINKIQRIIRVYFENLYSSKVENLYEMDKLLGEYNQPKLNQEDLEHLNSPSCNNLPTKKSLKDSRLNFTKPLRTTTNTPQIFPENRKGRKTTQFSVKPALYSFQNPIKM
jgi:hypothetical protein